MKEIEEIKERGSQAKTIIPHPDELTVEKWCEQNEIILQYLCDIQTLLSSLEKEKEGADRLESNLKMALAIKRTQWEELKKAEKCLEAERISVNELSLANQDLEARIQIYLQDIGNEQKLSNEIQGRLNDLEGAIQQAQEENPDEKHCTCVPLLKVRIKELVEAVERHKKRLDLEENGYWIERDEYNDANEELYKVLEKVKVAPSIGKLETMGEWNNEEEDIYTEQDGKKIKEVKDGR